MEVIPPCVPCVKVTLIRVQKSFLSLCLPYMPFNTLQLSKQFWLLAVAQLRTQNELSLNATFLGSVCANFTSCGLVELNGKIKYADRITSMFYGRANEHFFLVLRILFLLKVH